jgi:hypothetical protein
MLRDRTRSPTPRATRVRRLRLGSPSAVFLAARSSILRQTHPRHATSRNARSSTPARMPIPSGVLRARMDIAARSTARARSAAAAHRQCVAGATRPRALRFRNGRRSPRRRRDHRPSCCLARDEQAVSRSRCSIVPPNGLRAATPYVAPPGFAGALRHQLDLRFFRRVDDGGSVSMFAQAGA